MPDPIRYTGLIPGIAQLLSRVLIGIDAVSRSAILHCGITGDYCILTVRDDPRHNVLTGLLLIAGGGRCGLIKG